MKKLLYEKPKETCFVGDADSEEEIVVLRKPEIVRQSIVRNLLFFGLIPSLYQRLTSKFAMKPKYNCFMPPQHCP